MINRHFTTVDYLMLSNEASKKSSLADAAVIATNDDAFLCKYSAVKCGYFDDAFICGILKALDPPDSLTACIRPPIINRGTFARTLVIQRLVEMFLAKCVGCGTAQVVSFGAGYDTLPFRLFSSEMHCNLTYTELDFPSVTRSKCELVQSVQEISRLFASVDVIEKGLALEAVVSSSSSSKHRTAYFLHPCDLRDVRMLSDALKACRIDFTVPTLFLSECVLMYMNPLHSDALLRYAVTQFSGRRYFVNYEPIRPHDPFGQQMVTNIGRRGSPLLGIEAYPDVHAQKTRFEKCGWPSVDAVDMLQKFNTMFSFDEKLSLNRREPLDEMEEWNLIMSHYVILFACNASKASTFSLLNCDKTNE